MLLEDAPNSSHGESKRLLIQQMSTECLVCPAHPGCLLVIQRFDRAKRGKLPGRKVALMGKCELGVEAGRLRSLFLPQPLSLQSLVVKPDQLIKRRGKLGLVGVNLSLDGVKSWLKPRLGHEATVSLGVVGLGGVRVVTNNMVISRSTNL